MSANRVNKRLYSVREAADYLGRSVWSIRRLSLARLEALAIEMAQLGREHGKMGMLVVKRRAGRGMPTNRLVVMTESVFQTFQRAQSEGIHAE